MADGKIVIETKLDADGINKGINALRGQLNKLSSSLKDMLGKVSPAANDVAKDFNKVGQAVEGMASSGGGIKSTVADIENMRATLDNLTASLDNTNNQIELQKQKLQDLQFSYKIASNIDPSSERSLKLNDQILKTEARMISLTEKSDKTASKIWELDKAMERAANSTQSVEQNVERLDKGMTKASNSSKKLGKDIGAASAKTNAFGRNLARSGAQAAGLAATINRSFRSVLKRLFVYNLILKGIRGIMQYTGGALKTNSQFVESLNIVKTNLMVAFQPIYDFILPAINALMRGLATATTYIATAVSAIFGKTYQDSFNAAKSLDSAKKSMDDYGKSAKKAKGQLAGFDEINTLGGNDDSGASMPSTQAGFEMTMPDTTSIDTSVFDRLLSVLQPTIDAIKRMGAALEPLKKFAAQGLEDFYNRFLVPVGGWVMNEGLPRFIDAISKGIMSIDWSKLNDSLARFWNALAPFAINVGEGLLWFWENVLVPLGSWVIGDVLPVFLDILANGINVLNEVIEALKPLAEWLWDNFLEPIATWTGGVIISILESLADALSVVGDWISNNQSAVEAIAIVIGSFAAAWGLVNVAIGLWNIIGVIASGVTWALGAAVAFLTSPIGLVVLAIGALIAVIILVVKHWDSIKAVAGKVWEGIKNIYGAVADWFKDIFSKAWEGIKNIFSGVGDFFANVWQGIKNAFGGVADWFKNIFSKAWENVKNVFSVGGKIFSGLKDGIAGVFKSVVNGIIGGINKVIALPFDKINGMLNTIRGVGFLGISPFKKLWNENPLPVPQIPKLASGAVIPPRAEFLAVLGDQRHGRNLEAPESLIRQIFKQEMSKFMAQNQPAYAGGDTYVYIGNEQLDAYITRAVKRTQIKMNGG